MDGLINPTLRNALLYGQQEQVPANLLAMTHLPPRPVLGPAGRAAGNYLQDVVTGENLRQGLQNYRNALLQTAQAGMTGQPLPPEAEAALMDIFPGAGLAGMVGGPNAKIWKQAVADLAQQLEQKGATREEIWKKTGELGQPMWRDVGGQWRFEFSDEPAKMTKMAETLKEGGFGKTDLKTFEYVKNPDNTYDLTFIPKKAEKTSDIKSLYNVDDEVLNALLPESAIKKIKAGEGNLTWLGKDFKEGKRIDMDVTTEGINALPMEKVLSHPELYQAYPEMKNYLMQIDPSLGVGGSFRTLGNDKIITSGKGQQRSVTLHELTHGVQEKEKFARGGSPIMFYGEKIPSLQWEEWAQKSNQPEYKQLQKMRASKAYQNEINRGNQLWREKYEQKLDQLEKEKPARAERGTPEYKKNRDEYLAKRDKIFAEYNKEHYAPIQNEVQRLSDQLGGIYREPEKYESNFGAYRRLAGEAEARAVEARKDLTMKERLARPFWLDFDVPESAMLVRGEGGYPLSVKDEDIIKMLERNKLMIPSLRQQVGFTPEMEAEIAKEAEAAIARGEIPAIFKRQAE